MLTFFPESGKENSAGEYTLRNIILSYVFFQSEKPYHFPGLSICMVGKKIHVNKSGLFFFFSTSLQNKTNR